MSASETLTPAGPGRGRRDELDDDLVADEGLAPPVLADRAEQAVLDLVPLARPGREVADGDLETRLVGQLLELELPQPDPVAVAPAGVGGDEQARRIGIQFLAHGLPPAPDALDREGGRVVVGPDAHPGLVGGDVVDPIRA